MLISLSSGKIEPPPCKYNPFPKVLGTNSSASTVRHLDYRPEDETLVAAGEIGSGTGIALYRPSLSGNNLGLLDFKWEMSITTADWAVCGVKLPPTGLDTVLILACNQKR